MSYEVIDVDRWRRKEQYEFFIDFDEPFTGVVVDLNVSMCRDITKLRKLSFFQVYLHCCLRACVRTEGMCLRVVDGEVRKYEEVHASAVLMRSDKSFGFSHIPFSSDFTTFSANVAAEKERVENDRSLFPPVNLPNEIHCSAMPWIQFKGLSHARKYGTGDTCPKVSFGKVYEKNSQWWMPVSVHVHHALADGIDMAAFLDAFQEELLVI